MSLCFTSFEELGAHKGINPATTKAKKYRCHKCGSTLREIPGTNVMVCDGTDKDGKPCGNRVLKSVMSV